jgi:threonine synthase
MRGSQDRATALVSYIVSTTGERLSVEQPLWRANDGSHLNLSPGTGLSLSQIDSREHSLWRYASAIRLDRSARVSLGEGWTPLIVRRWRQRSIHFKLEFLQPTGSFKDRGASVMMSYLRSVGVSTILEDSSGNAGASIAAYAAAGGLRARILVPADAPVGKLQQIAAAGAEVVPIAGNRQDVSNAALRESEHYFYASHNWQPFFLEGTKTLAFELWEQLDAEVPDAVIVPLGYGSNVLGLSYGFAELQRRGAIDHGPRIYAVQAANCAAFGTIWRSGGDEWLPFDPKPTVADGIASIKPVRIREVLSAIRTSGGSVIMVSEEEIVAGMKAILATGLYVEPTSATAAAALEALIAGGSISPSDRVVVVLTGHGLKAPARVDEMLKST